MFFERGLLKMMKRCVLILMMLSVTGNGAILGTASFKSGHGHESKQDRTVRSPGGVFLHIGWEREAGDVTECMIPGGMACPPPDYEW